MTELFWPRTLCEYFEKAKKKIHTVMYTDDLEKTLSCLTTVIGVASSKEDISALAFVAPTKCERPNIRNGLQPNTICKGCNNATRCYADVEYMSVLMDIFIS